MYDHAIARFTTAIRLSASACTTAAEYAAASQAFWSSCFWRMISPVAYTPQQRM